MIFQALTQATAHGLLYAQMLVNVFLMTTLDCNYSKAHPDQLERLCRSPVMYCTTTLINGLNDIYQDQVRREYHRGGSWPPPTQFRIDAEERLVCSLLFYPECQESPSCRRDLELAIPYWYAHLTGTTY